MIALQALVEALLTVAVYAIVLGVPCLIWLRITRHTTRITDAPSLTITRCVHGARITGTDCMWCPTPRAHEHEEQW